MKTETKTTILKTFKTKTVKILLSWDEIASRDSVTGLTTDAWLLLLAVQHNMNVILVLSTNAANPVVFLIHSSDWQWVCLLQGVLNELLSVSNSDLTSVTATQQALSNDEWWMRKLLLTQVQNCLHLCCMRGVLLCHHCICWWKLASNKQWCIEFSREYWKWKTETWVIWIERDVRKYRTDIRQSQ